MTQKKKTPKPNKLNAWFRAFIDETNPSTFMNQTGSAKAANYKCSTEASFANVGLQNFRKLEDRIKKWLDEVGLSENELKTKLVKLMDAKETKFFQFQGEVTDSREIEALEVQRKTLDMAMKVRGMYAPKKRELSGKDGEPLTITTLIPEPDPPIDNEISADN